MLGGLYGFIVDVERRVGLSFLRLFLFGRLVRLVGQREEKESVWRQILTARR